MEEWIGERWHHFISRRADTSFGAHAVTLDSVSQPVGVLFRAAGGAPGVRVVPAAVSRIGGPRGWLQRLAGSGLRAALPQLDGDTLALPPRIAVFDDAVLNRDLYLWLAVLAAAHRPGAGWIEGNARATQEALRRCPGLRPRWDALLAAHLAQRPAVDAAPDQAAEVAVQTALRGQVLAGKSAGCDFATTQVAPVWLWLEVMPAGTSPAPVAADSTAGTAGSDVRSATRRRTRRAEQRPGRAPLLLPSRAEALMSWSEHVPLDRASDDEDDGQALAAADDMEQLSVSRTAEAPASRVKFDLDLPSASADDMVLGEGLKLPEWDWKAQRLKPAHCSVVTVVARPGAAFVPDATLRATARRVRRRLEVQRAAPAWQRGCNDGEAIDLDAWVLHRAARSQAACDPRVFTRRVRGEHSLATLLLADLSLSTDAHVNDTQRVIDVIRDALFVFGEALHGGGDAFAMLGFSSVRRSHVRLQHLKGFDEAWGAVPQARVGAIKPGYYTRMGAALRAATLQLAGRHERQRLLLILTDGKPNDIDVYEGRWGLEDTRHAVHEAREAGLLPFCLSIDDEAHAYLPHLFGRQGYAHVRRPAELPARLAAVYARLTR